MSSKPKPKGSVGRLKQTARKVEAMVVEEIAEPRYIEPMSMRYSTHRHGLVHHHKEA